MVSVRRKPGRILTLVDKRKTIGQIGDKFKVCGQTIRHVLKRLGLTKRLEAKIQANRVEQSARTRAKNAMAR